MRLFEDSWVSKGVTYIREYDKEKNKSITSKTPFKSEYFVKDQLGSYKGFLDNEPLRKVKGSSYNVPDAYGSKNSRYVAIRELHFGKSSYNTNPCTWFLDIETSVATQEGSKGFPKPELALEPIVLIQFWDTCTNKGYVLGLEEWYKREDYTYDFDLEYIKYDTEKDLMNGFIDFFQKQDPFLIYAWNGELFDFPYIFNRLKNIGINPNKLSNHGSAKLKTKTLDNGVILNDIESQGHQWLDLMVIYKKFVFKNVPTYSLDFIGELETGNKKISHDNYIKFDDFRIGKYVITGKETEKQKETLIYKCAVVLERGTTPEKELKYTKYIKEKSYSDFVDYGVRDFVLLKGIHDSQNFTQLITSMAQEMGCLLPDTLGTLKAWDSYITSYIAGNKQIAPPSSNNSRPEVIGGYVRKPEVGKHKWIMSTDVNSMYPLLGMASFNMSPETFIPFSERPKEVQELNKLLGTQDEEQILAITEEEWVHIRNISSKYNISLGVGGAVFSKDNQGVIPKLVTNIYKDRKVAKKEMFVLQQKAINSEGTKELEYNKQAQLKDTEQMTAKIKINSLYGALASKHFSMYNESIAKAITGSGRYFIRLLAQEVETKLQKLIKNSKPYVLYGDTDSIYFHIEPFVDKYTKDKSITEKTQWSNKFYEKVIEPLVQDTIKILSLNLGAYDDSYIGAEREVIAPVGLFVAKKKYCMQVTDLEGKIYPQDSPYSKIQGLEIIKGGTPEFSKKYLKEAVPVILNSSDDDIRDWFKTVRSKFLDYSLDDIAKTQGVSKIEDPNWGQIINGRKVAIPFGSRVCVATNNYIKNNNLTDQYPLIDAGEKVKVLFLRQPNKLKSEAFGFNDTRFALLFKEVIDYDTTFYKFFVSPLEGMLDALGINLIDETEELDAW